jgi:hypothetical protein
MKAEDLHYLDELLGCWEIRYPGKDGMIVKSHVESLELKVDGTFSWNPTPLWVKPEGRWSIAGNPQTQQMKLYIEQRKGHTFRGEWLVLTTLRFEEREERMIHWQRTQYEGVVFKDRVLTGRWLGPARGLDPVIREGA